MTERTFEGATEIGSMLSEPKVVPVGTRRSISSFSFFVAFCLALVLGCSNSSPRGGGGDGPTGTGDDGGGVPTTGAPPGLACEGDETQECSGSNGTQAGVLSCYEGTQNCVDGAWSTCAPNASVSASRVTAPPSDQTVDSGSSACGGNACDPGCRSFDTELPPVVDGGTPVVEWETGTYGSVDDLPPGLGGFGFVQPCTDIEDCQYNTTCYKPLSGDCSHELWETGIPLDPGCHSCVDDICGVKPSCCSAPSVPPLDECPHDPCVTGTKLKSTCSPCVAAVCAAIPGCCTGAWSTACVAEVANCDGACGCQVEESTFGGSCYWRNTSSTKWPNAQTTCSGRGPGWDLTGIGSDPENEHVKLNAALGEEVWIGLTDRSPYSPTVGEWRWVSGDPTGFWEESAPDPSFYENWALGEPDDTNRYARMESSGDWDARKSTEKAK